MERFQFLKSNYGLMTLFHEILKISFRHGYSMRGLGTVVMSLIVLSALPTNAPLSNLTPLQLISSENTYFASASRDISPSRIDNVIYFVKNNKTGQDIKIRLEGSSFGFEDHPLTMTLLAPNREIRDRRIISDFFGVQEFFVSANDIMGMYEIYLSVEKPPSNYHSCCVHVDYRIQYSGLSTPPYVEALGDVFFFPFGRYFSALRNDGLNLKFSAFLEKNEIYTINHNPWGPHDIISYVELHHSEVGTVKPYHYDNRAIDSDFVKYQFRPPSSEYYDIMAHLTSTIGNEPKIMGFNLFNENETSHVPLLPTSCIDGCDSDFDMLPDHEEHISGLDPFNKDFDGDFVGDGIEYKFNTDPGTYKSTPFNYTITTRNFEFFGIERGNSFELILGINFNKKHLHNLEEVRYQVYGINSNVIDGNHYRILKDNIPKSNFLNLTFDGSFQNSLADVRIFVTYYFDDDTVFAESFSLTSVLRDEPIFPIGPPNLIDDLIQILKMIIPLIILILLIRRFRQRRLRKSLESLVLYPELTEE